MSPQLHFLSKEKDNVITEHSIKNMALIFYRLPNAGGVWTVGVGKAVGVGLAFFSSWAMCKGMRSLLTIGWVFLLANALRPTKVGADHRGDVWHLYAIASWRSTCIPIWVHPIPMQLPLPPHTLTLINPSASSNQTELHRILMKMSHVPFKIPLQNTPISTKEKPHRLFNPECCKTEKWEKWERLVVLIPERKQHDTVFDPSRQLWVFTHTQLAGKSKKLWRMQSKPSKVTPSPSSHYSPTEESCTGWR